MTPFVGGPAAAWLVAKPLTASPSPPVRAKGQYSAVRWTTPIRSAGATGGRCAAFRAARRLGAVRRWDFGAGVVAPMVVSCQAVGGSSADGSPRIAGREYSVRYVLTIRWAVNRAPAGRIACFIFSTQPRGAPW